MHAPAGPIDCGNSGTTLRLLPGILVGQEGRFELTGDESLRSRPVERIVEPLRQMGASIESEDGHAPIVVEGGRELSGIRYELPVASAQVKSAVLLAGLYASGDTTGRRADSDPRITRSCSSTPLGVPVRRSGHRLSVGPVERLEPAAASTWIRATSRRQRRSSSRRRCSRIGADSSRTSGSIRRGPACSTSSAGWARRSSCSTGGGSAASRSATSRCTRPSSSRRRSMPEEVPRLIDELPLVALAAARRTRRDGDPRRRRAARQGNGPNRKCQNFAQSPWRARRRRAMMSSG